MLKIRLQRVGRKNIPVFRVVLTDSKNSTKSGKYLEVLGSFDPVNDVKTVDADRVKYWISKGAKPSETLHNFLITEKIIEGKKINVLPRKSPIKKEQNKEEVAKKEEAKALESKPESKGESKAEEKPKDKQEEKKAEQPEEKKEEPKTEAPAA